MNNKIALFLLLAIFATFSIIVIALANIQMALSDELTILKDPLKILYSYYNGSIPEAKLYTFYWIVLAFEFILFIAGKLLNLWNNVYVFLTELGCGNLFPFPIRLLPLTFAFLNAFAIFKIANTISKLALEPANKETHSTTSNQFVKLIVLALLLFNPVFINIAYIVKFDVFAYLLYNLLFFFGLIVAFRNDDKSLFYLTIFLWIGLATRIEFISFFVGYLLLILASIQNINIKQILKWNAIGFLIYALIIWIPPLLSFLLFANKGGKAVSHTFSFAYAHARFIATDINTLIETIISSLQHEWTSLTILNLPILLFILWVLIRTLKKQSTNNSKVQILKILIFPLTTFFIHMGILTLHSFDSFRYLLLPFTATIWLFIALLFVNKHIIKQHLKLWKVAGLLTIFLYITYNFDILRLASTDIFTNWSKRIWTYVQNNSETGETVASNVAPDCSLILCPDMIRKKLEIISSRGGSTGLILQKHLQIALQDSSNCINVYHLATTDFFWTNTPYEGKWIITSIARLDNLNPSWIILSANKDFVEKDLYIVSDASYSQLTKHLKEKNYKLTLHIIPKEPVFPWTTWYSEWLGTHWALWTQKSLHDASLKQLPDKQ